MIRGAELFAVITVSAMRFGLGWALLLTATAAAQATPPSSPAMQPSANPAAHTYANAALHLTFAYPAALQPRDAADADALGQRMVNGENTQPDSGPVGPAPCTKTLLALETKPGASGAGGGLVAHLTLFDIDLHCLPPKAVKNKKLLYTTLRGFAMQGVTLLGMMPVGDPVGYLLDGHPAYFAASEGTPVARADLQAGESQVMGVVAVAAEEHIVAWMMDSNDAAFFHRMLASPVDLGAGAAQPLFPAGLHPE